MSRLSRKQAFETIGGPLLIDWGLYLIATPFVLIFSVLINANLLTPEQTPTVLLVAVVSTATMFGWSLIFDRVLFRNRDRKPINIVGVVFFGFGLGVVKALSSEGLFVWFNIIEPSLSSALQRSLPVGLATLTLVLVVPLSEYNRIQYQARRDSLVGSLVQQELDKQKDYFDEADLGKISAGIQKVRSSNSAKEASEGLRKLVEKVIRPQSHKLWRKQSARFPNYTSRELLGYALLNSPFNPVSSTLLTAFGVFLFNVFREPFGSAVARTIIVGVTVFVFYLVASKIEVRTVTSGIWLFALVVLVSSIVGFYVSIVLAGEPFFSIAITHFLVYFFWQLMNTLAVAAFKAIFDNSKTVDEELTKLNQDGALDESVREIIGRINSRELADHLHSTVQNQVLASSLRLEKTDLSKQEIANELDVLENILESNSESFLKSNKSSIEAELAEIKNRWDGFVAIQATISTAVPKTLVKKLQQILEEAISNAVRHGHAENIKIQIAETGENIFLSVIDDGFGPREGKPGLGTSLFETASLGRWKFEAADGGGSRLVVLL